MAYDGSVKIKALLDDGTLKKQLTSIKSNIATGMKNVAKVSTVALAGVTAGVGALSTASVKISETTDRVDKLSQKIGMSRESFQEWDFILSQNGASVDGLQTSMKTLSAAADDVNTGGKTYTEQFKKLGVSVTDVNGNMKDQETLFNEVFTALQGVKDETTRTAIASDLLGKSATELAPALNAGSDAIEEQRQKAHDLGLVLSDETIDAGVKLTDSMDQLKRSGESVMTSFLTPIISPLNNLLQGFIGLSTGVDGAENQIVTSLSTMTTKVIDMIINVLPTVVKLGVTIIKSLITGIIKALPAVIESISYLVGYIIGTIQNNSGEILETGKNILIWIKDGIVEIVPKIISKIGEMILDLINAISENKDKILETGKNIIAWIIDGVTSLLTSIAELAGTIINKLVSGIFNNKGSILETGVKILGWIIDGVISVISTVLNIAVNIIDSFLSGITGKHVDIVNIGKSILTWFIDGINGIISNVTDVGSYVVQGFINGITKGKDLVVKKAKELGSSFLGGIKNVLGIASPSKKMKTIGGYVVEGFNNGINDAKDGAIKNADDFGTDIIETVNAKTEDAKTAGSNVGEAIADGITEAVETVPNEVENTLNSVEAKVFSWKDVMTSAFDSVVSGFSAIGGALANNELSWKSMGSVALQTLADVLSAIASQLTALAVVNWYNVPLALAYGAGAVAAKTASGYFSSKANSYDVGGIIQGDQLAMIHDKEGILPAGIMADAKTNGLMIQPLNNSSNKSLTLIQQLDGKVLTRTVIDNIDNEVGLTNVG